MNPREIAVFLAAPSPNQSKSFKKNPFGMPAREKREAEPPRPVTRFRKVSQALRKESIIGLE